MYKKSILLFCLILSGCSTAALLGIKESYSTVEDAQKNCEVKIGQYAKTDRVILPGGALESRYFLKYVANQAKATSGLYGIQADYWGDDWIFVNSCYDSNGKNLNCSPVDSKAHGRKVDEIVSILTPREYLQDASAAGGLKFQLNGKRGNAEFFIPSISIEGFLKCVDEYKQDKGTK